MDPSFAKYQVIEVRQPPRSSTERRAFAARRRRRRRTPTRTLPRASRVEVPGVPTVRHRSGRGSRDVGGARADPSAPRVPRADGIPHAKHPGRIRDCVSAANRALYEGRDPHVAADDVLREKEEEERRVAAAKIRAGSNKRARRGGEEEEEEEDDPDERRTILTGRS